MSTPADVVKRCCPVCGSDDESDVYCEASIDAQRLDSYAFASRKFPEYMRHRLVRCRTCDALYASPAPRTEALLDAYEEASFDSSEEAARAARTYAALVRGFVAELPDRVGALDIGTGDGAFLRELVSMDFRDVAGLEPSRAPIAAAADDVKPLIRHGAFRPGELAEGALSLITCFQTIEHVREPLPLVRECHRLLKPGGALFLAAHNHRALSARVLGLRSPIIDIEHMQLLSKRSARELLARSGFERVVVRPFWNRYPLHYWFKLLPLPADARRKIVHRLRSSRLGRVAVPLPAGNLVAIGWKAR